MAASPRDLAVMESGVQLTIGTNASYRAEKLVTKRKTKAQDREEYLVKWVLQKPPDKLTKEEEKAFELTTKEYCMWMWRDEIEACNPDLISASPASRVAMTLGDTQDTPSAGTNLPEIETDGSLEDMREDVEHLIGRARKLMERERRSTGGVAGGKVLSSVVGILSAYAKIGNLTDAFQEYGAVDLLLGLMSSKNADVRRNSSDMLRSLTTYDLTIRGYVLLHLIKGDEGSNSSLQSRQMLLDTFAETSSSDENDLRGIAFPQIPGRFIFSILKKYLRVTSTLHSFSASPPSLPELNSLQDDLEGDSEFNIFHLWSQLLGEMFDIFNWYDGALAPAVQRGGGMSLKGISIFTGTAAKEISTAPKKKKKKKNLYKTRTEFDSDKEYGLYVKSVLQNRPGFKVRARTNYESVREGDLGTYINTNQGMPPAQFSWVGLGEEPYWVFWHIVELLPPPEKDDDSKDEDSSADSDPLASAPPYVMHSLMQLGPRSEASNKVCRPFWWEVLSLMKSLPNDLTPDVVEVLANTGLKTFKDLISFTPTYSQVAAVFQLLVSVYPHLTQEPLSIKDLPEFHDVYTDPTPTTTSTATTKGGESHIAPRPLNADPPYADPFDTEPQTLGRRIPEGGTAEMMIRNLRDQKRDTEEPTIHLRSLAYLQDGSPQKLEELRGFVERYHEKHPRGCRVGVYSCHALKAAYEKLNITNKRESCVDGHFALVLRLMDVEPTSCTLQVTGLEAFFYLMGGYGMDETLPLPPSVERGHVPNPLSRKVVRTVLHSLSDSTNPSDCIDLRVLFRGVQCVINWYHTKLTPHRQENCRAAVRHSLWIIYFLAKHQEIKYTLQVWHVPQLVEQITNRFAVFPTKDELLKRMRDVLPEHIPSFNRELAAPDLAKTLNHDIMKIVEDLKRITADGKNPLPTLLGLMDRDLSSDSLFRKPSKMMATAFLLHHGVFYLGQAMKINKCQGFTENAVVILASLVTVGEEEAAQVVLQGGLRALLIAMGHKLDVKMIQTIGLETLDILSQDPDILIVMSTENILAPLRALKERYSSSSQMCKVAQKLMVLCESEETARSSLHQKILSIIFSGTLLTLLNAVEQSRRERDTINIPKFSPIIKHLSSSRGGTLTMVEQDQWWEEIELSSNGQMLHRLLDGDSETYWETYHRSNPVHWIRIHMKKGVTVRKMYLEVKASDEMYKPQRVVVRGGTEQHNLEEIGAVYIPATFTGKFAILSDLQQYYPIISVDIHRSFGGGYDTRVRGLTCQGTRSSLWPIFGNLYLARSKLFYRIQVQSWLSDVNLGPLELFDKLSSVMVFEQNFADHFLLTAIARLCIGQACRSGIVTPLIETMTEETAGPNLGKLIHQYIQEVSLPPSEWDALASSCSGSCQVSQEPMAHLGHTQDKQTLIQMSCVRRMCRILVDCDDNVLSRKIIQQVKGEEAEEEEERKKDDTDKVKGYEGGGVAKGEEPLELPGAGTKAVAKCWKEIVCQEVSKVLLEYDGDPPLVLCAKLLKIYNTLTQVKLELFGEHSQFSIALKDGATNAFQCLDPIRSAKVCERLSLSIDLLMDPLGEGGALCSSLREHQREDLLLQLAEPLQFLHTLDLMHTFEYYYRRHLSSRLLCGRSLSLPLENRLAHAFAHCFPNKFPLQMLQDLEECGKLMDKFCHHNLLERLDQVMVQANMQSELPDEALELSRKATLYRRRCLNVYILNQSHWPLRQVPLPLVSLPSYISTFCHDYSHFFASAHMFGRSPHERARKVQFTPYGWAFMSYGNSTLQTSTVQMMILLQFNLRNSMTLAALQEATRLTFDDLSQALVCLTAEGQDILSHLDGKQDDLRPPSGRGDPPSGRGASSISAWGKNERDEFVPVKRFRPAASFMLNEQFLGNLGNSSVCFKDVHVVERRKESSHKTLEEILERRRDIIDAAIVKILKREKEQSLDSIAATVIKGCSMGRFDPGISFGRFECDYRDICSRVYRLVRDGYIYRSDVNQQMLVYVPDNLSATAFHVAVPRAEDQKRSALKTTPPPLSHAARSNKPKQDSMEAWSYFPALDEEGSAPLLGMVASCLTTPPSEVEATMRGIVARFSEVLATDLDTTEHLLNRCFWRQISLLDAYQNRYSDLLYETGLAPRGATAPAPPFLPMKPAKKSTCTICLNVRDNEEFLALWCGHFCCKECWGNHVKSRLHIDNVYGVACVQSKCRASPTRAWLLRHFGEDSKTLKLYSDALFREYVKTSGWETWCSNPQGCDRILRGSGIRTNICHKCQWTSCCTCNFIEGHEPVSCDLFRRWQASGGIYLNMNKDALSQHLAQLISKKCPKCSIRIERNEGCMHMHCKCGYHFCWRCLKSWNPTHTDFFSCRSEFSRQAIDKEKFTVYNQRCISLQKPRLFAEKLCVLVKGMSENVPIKTLSFLIDACQLLVQCHKMLVYAIIAVYYSTEDQEPQSLNTPEYLTILTETLESDTHALQAFLENALFSQPDLARSIRSLPERRILEGYRLVGKIESIREKFLIGQHHRCKIGEVPPLKDYKDHEE